MNKLRPNITWKDRYGRIWFEWLRWRFSLLGFIIEIEDAQVRGLTIGYEPGWLARQEKKEQCRMCKRFVSSACHDANSYHQDGPWDTWCHDVFRRGI